MRAFEHLQALASRQHSDYEVAFATCHASGRPFECLSLLRYMVKDELPRDMQWYEATARLAAEKDNWVTALDTYIMFERKEEVRRWSWRHTHHPLLTHLLSFLSPTITIRS